MSVLIRGIEMPTSCGFCLFEKHTDDGYECCINGCLTEYQKRPDDCPLVPVPPHGDLIDRNALPWEKQGMMLTDPDEWGIDARDIEAAPIIIPAEEESYGYT